MALVEHDDVIETLASTETQPFAVSISDQRELLAESEDFQTEEGTASEKAGQGGE